MQASARDNECSAMKLFIINKSFIAFSVQRTLKCLFIYPLITNEILLEPMLQAFFH